MTNTRVICWGSGILLSAFLGITFLPDPNALEVNTVYAQSNKCFTIQEELNLIKAEFSNSLKENSSSKDGIDSSISWGTPVELPSSVPGQHYSAEEKSYWSSTDIWSKLTVEPQYEGGYSYITYKGYKYYLCAISARVSLTPGVDPDYDSINNKAIIPRKYGLGHLFLLNFTDGTSMGILPVDSKGSTGNGWGHEMSGPGGKYPSVIEFAASDEGYGSNGQPFIDKDGPLYNKTLKSVQKGPDIKTSSLV